MTSLFLFTNSFPYGKGETFIGNEIHYLALSFKHVYIIPLVREPVINPLAFPCNVTVLSPMTSFTIQKRFILLFHGLINAAPLGFSLHELLKKRVYTRKQWFMNWLSYTCLTRAALSSKQFRSIIKIIKDQDIIYSYWADNAANLLPFIKKERKVKTVVRFHGTDLYEEIKGDYLPFRERLFEGIDLAVFISDAGKVYFQKRYPGVIENTIVSRLGVLDNGINQPSEGDELHIVSCSSIVNDKRVHLIPQALSFLDFNVQWTHIGSGPLLHEVLEATSSLPQNIRFELLGHISHEDVLSLYSTKPVDLFINVSSTEGIPVSIMEAISMGIPVIATNVGGMAEIINHDNGILIPADIAPAEIAKHISWFYYNAPREQMRKNARSVWNNYFNADANYQHFCNMMRCL